MVTFIADIIQALPEAVATALATLFFGGILAFIFQKPINAYFDRRLEHFKADLQQTLTENRIRIEKTLPKKLEVLETLHQKFDLYVGSCINSIVLRDEQAAELNEKRSEFINYLADNSKYLPNNIVSEINKSLFESISIYENASENLDAYTEIAALGELINKLNEQTRKIEEIYKSVAKIED